jgi:plastocyanin
MTKGCSPASISYSVATTIACVLVITVLSLVLNPNPVASTQAASSQQQQQQQPNINATSLFDTGQMILPENAKHLVILIPDEGHHGPGEEDEARFIAQPFVPQSAIVSPGTEVVWFSGDVGHEHNIVVRNGDATETQVFKTGEFAEFAASRPIMFNTSGNFEYADTVEYEGGFVMTGNVTVVNQNSDSTGSSGGSFDTVGALMVPSMMIQSVTGEMRNMGFGIDSTHTFTDLRGGQEDTGDQQVLLIWTTAGKGLEEITSYLGEISEPLPYE